nr:PREDICTED: pollen-specific leucine-rich repeat extensin-like protein 1 isoform X2 [Bemisia tabaci]
MNILRLSLLFFCVSFVFAEYGDYNNGDEQIEDLSSAKARDAEQSSLDSKISAEDQKQDQPQDEQPKSAEKNDSKEHTSTEEPKTKAPETTKAPEADAAKKGHEAEKVKPEHETEKGNATTTAAPAKDSAKKEPATQKAEPVVTAVNPASRAVSEPLPRVHTPQGFYTPYNSPGAYGPYAFPGPYPAQSSFIPAQQWARQHGSPPTVPAPAPQYAYHHFVSQTQEPQIIAHEYPHYQYSYSPSSPQYSAPAYHLASAPAPQHTAPAPAPAPASAPSYHAPQNLYTPEAQPIAPPNLYTPEIQSIPPPKPASAPAKPKPTPVKAPTTTGGSYTPAHFEPKPEPAKPKPVPVGTKPEDIDQRSRYVWNCAIQPSQGEFRNEQSLEPLPLDQRANPANYASQPSSMPTPFQQKYGNYYPAAGQDVSLHGRQMPQPIGLPMLADQPHYPQSQSMMINPHPQGHFRQPDELRALEPQDLISQPEQAVAPQPQGLISQSEQFRAPHPQPGQLLYPQPLGPMAQPDKFRYPQPQGPMMIQRNQLRYPQMQRTIPVWNPRNMRYQQYPAPQFRGYQQPLQYVPGMPLSPEFLSRPQMRSFDQMNYQSWPQSQRTPDMHPILRQNYAPESAQMMAEDSQRSAQTPNHRGQQPGDHKITQEFQGSAKGWNVDVSGKWGPAPHSTGRSAQPDSLPEQPIVSGLQVSYPIPADQYLTNKKSEMEDNFTSSLLRKVVKVTDELHEQGHW